MPIKETRKHMLSKCFLALTLLLVGCGGGDDLADISAREGILLIGNGTEPKALDPHIVTGVPENRIIQALIEGLIAYHPTDDTAPEPGMAESWTHNENYTQWEFKLREDAKWTNGDPVTAHDFVYSWQRILSPALGGEYAAMLYVLEGAEAFNKGETLDFSDVGVKAIDDHTLIVNLVGPVPHFLSMLKHYTFYPVNPRAVEAAGGMVDRRSAWSTVENYVGNGPFVLKSWATNKVITVAKNPDYWDAERVRLNEIHFFPVENVNTEETMYRGGRLHITSTVPISKIPLFKEKYADEFHIDPYLGTYYYSFNVTRPPFNDPKVRLALAYAINRELLTDKVTKAGENPATSFVPAGIVSYDAPQLVKYDPERAKELLAEAGFPNGEGFPKKEILINTSEGHRRIAEAIQAMWRETLGIDVGIYNQEWKVYLDTRFKLDYDIARAGWIADYVYPTTFLNMFTTGNGNNQTGWSNERYDQIIRDARVVQSEEERMSLLKEAEEILLQEMPVLPIYWYTTKYLLDPRLKEYNPKLLDYHPYKYLYFEVE